MGDQAEGKTGPVHLEEIGQIAITVRDLPRSKDFYRDVLGMKFLFDAGTMAFFLCGSVRLMIGLAEEPVSVAGTVVYFKVEKIEETHASLKGRGVTFLAAPHMVARMPDHDLWMAFLEDLDGNRFGLMSEVARADAG